MSSPDGVAQPGDSPCADSELPEPMLPEPPVPEPGRLYRLIAAMNERQVLMLVDLVADRFLFGDPKRISREAPVLILQHEREELVPGGGANAVANVRSLGGRPIPIGSVGRDQSGAALLARLREMDIDTRWIKEDGDWTTPTKTRILGGARHTVKQQIVRYDTGTERNPDEPGLAALSKRVLAAAEAVSAGSVATSGPTVVILSDYGYGGVDPRLVPRLRETLGEAAVLLVDSRYRLADFRGMDAATPNQDEAEVIAGRPLEADDDLVAAGPVLLDKLGGNYVVVTRGSEGMALFERCTDGIALTVVPAAGSSQVADVTGAGDTVIGTFGLAIAAGATPLEATLLANYAGGAVVAKAGTATLEPEELVRAVETDLGALEAIRFPTAPEEP